MANDFTTTAFTAGTYLLPSVYFSTDMTTGLYRVAANQLGITVSATHLVTFASNAVTITGSFTATRDAATAINNYSYNTATSHGQLNFYCARGTTASPAVLASGDNVGAIYARSWSTGTTFSACGLIRWVSTETHSATAAGTKLQFYICPNTTAAVAAGMEIGQDKTVTTYGDEVMASTAYKYLGASGTNGSWRIGRSGDDLVFERRESGSWVTKLTIED